MFNVDFDKLADIFRYNPAEAFLFNSSFFLFFLTGVLLLYSFVRKYEPFKIAFLVFCSFYFYYKTNGLYLLLILFVVAVDYVAAHLIYDAPDQKKKKMWLILSLVLDLGILFYFKYTNFLIDTLFGLVNRPFQPLDIMLPIGISFFIFQSLSYVIDVYRGKITPLRHIIDYTFYVSFFPQLVAGPIVRAKDFIPQIHQSTPLSKETWGEAFMLIMLGLFKKCIISDYISVNFVDRVFDAPTLYSGVENLFAVYGYAVQIYCDFSGYSDMAIGIALLFGYRFCLNFNLPYRSASVTEFWKRWHISLSTWLKDYLYISLGGNRKGKKRMYANLMLTMLLGGLWHGASLRFLLWGGLHGTYLVAHKGLMHLFPSLKANGADMPVWQRIIGTVITFHLVCFGWIFFRADTMDAGMGVLSQIFFHFNSAVFLPFVKGYTVILLLISVCLLSQFVPSRWVAKARLKVVEMSWWAKTFLLVILIVLITQVKSSELQPFIYFQF